jgi:hypothetical protein
MSKPRKIKKRKRKTGFINLTPKQPFNHRFATFAQLAAWTAQEKKNAV